MSTGFLGAIFVHMGLDLKRRLQRAIDGFRNVIGRAELDVVVRRAIWENGEIVGYREEGREKKLNLILNNGRVQLHTQGYGTSGLATTGFCYMALSDDSTNPAATDTTLTGEISTNGLARALSTVTLATGSGNQTTVAHTFTCATASQAAQRVCLFNAASNGASCHSFKFTERTLQVGDQLSCTVTITLG